MCWSKPGGSSLVPYYEGILDTPIAPYLSVPFQAAALVVKRPSKQADFTT